MPEGLISSFPCRAAGGEWEIIQGVEIDEFSRERIDAWVNELNEETRRRRGPGPPLTSGEFLPSAGGKSPLTLRVG